MTSNIQTQLDSKGTSSITGLSGLSDVNIANNTMLIGNTADNMVTSASDNAVSNIGIGRTSLDALTDGDQNIAIGQNSLDALTTGSNNVAIGHNSLSASNDSYNIAIGTNALQKGTTASQNVAIGGNAMSASTTADFNIAIGQNALTANTQSANNIAIGWNALKTLNGTSTGDAKNNVAIGRDALELATEGIQNTFIGAFAGDELLDSDNNTAIGYNALGKLTTGDKNTAVGAQALQEANDLNNGAANNALENTAVGYDALGDVTYGDYNTAIGKNSGNIIRGGTGNTFVGSGANVPSGNYGASNRTAIGKSAIVSSNNTIQMGNDNVTLLKVGDGTATVTAASFTGSDMRFKDAIEPLKKKFGLQLINKLNPVTYNWLRSGKSDMGLIAQDVEKLDVGEIDLVGSFVTSNQEERLSVAYPKLVVPLIKAVQELSAEIDRLKLELEQLKNEKRN